MAEHEIFDPGITPEQLAARARQDAEDKDCNLAKREHKWRWIWENPQTWTGNRMCGTCGKVEMNVSREKK